MTQLWNPARGVADPATEVVPLEASRALAVYYDRPVFGVVGAGEDEREGEAVRLVVVGQDRRAWAAANSARLIAGGFDIVEPRRLRLAPSAESGPSSREAEGWLVHARPRAERPDYLPGVRWLHPVAAQPVPDDVVFGPWVAAYPELDSGLPTHASAADLAVLVIEVVLST